MDVDLSRTCNELNTSRDAIHVLCKPVSDVAGLMQGNRASLTCTGKRPLRCPVRNRPRETIDFYCCVNAMKIHRFAVWEALTRTIQTTCAQKTCSEEATHTHTHAHTVACTHAHTRVCNTNGDAFTHTHTYLHTHVSTQNAHAHKKHTHAHAHTHTHTHTMTLCPHFYTLKSTQHLFSTSCVYST